jgi:hypothetical protein
MANYTVHYGHMLIGTAEFEQFKDALEHYSELFYTGFEVRMTGMGAEEADENGDGYSDGLTDEEREAVEAAS